MIKGYRQRLGCTRGSLCRFSKTAYWNRAFLDFAVNNPTVHPYSPQNSPTSPYCCLLNSTNYWSHSPHHYLFFPESRWLYSVWWAAPLPHPLLPLLFRIPFSSSFDQTQSWLLLVGGMHLEKTYRSVGFSPIHSSALYLLADKIWDSSGDPGEQCLKRIWPLSWICRAAYDICLC